MERTEAYLNRLAKDLCKEHWGLDLTIPVKINGRLRKLFARFTGALIYQNGKETRKPKSIDISSFASKHFKDEAIVDVLKHELCHYACFVNNKPFKDGDVYFEMELKRVGACSNTTSKEEKINRGYVYRSMVA